VHLLQKTNAFSYHGIEKFPSPSAI